MARGRGGRPAARGRAVSAASEAISPWLSYARASSDEQTESCGQQHQVNERVAGSPPEARVEDDGVTGQLLRHTLNVNPCAPNMQSAKKNLLAFFGQ